MSLPPGVPPPPPPLPPPPPQSPPGWGPPPGPQPARRRPTGLVVAGVVVALVAVAAVVIGLVVLLPSGDDDASSNSADAPSSTGTPSGADSFSPSSPSSASSPSSPGQPSWQTAYADDARAPEQAAERLAVALTSLRAGAVTRQLRHIETLTTPSYRTEIQGVARQFAQVARDTHLKSRAEVDDTALAALSGDRATVLVASTSHSTSTDHATETPSSYRLRIAVRRIASRWLVDDAAFENATTTPQETGPLLADAPFDTLADHLTAVLSYTPDDIEQSFDSESRFLTGEFAQQYAGLHDTLVTQVRQHHVTSQATVVDVGIVADGSTPDHPRALVFLHTEARSDLLTQPKSTDSGALVTLTRVDGAWRISALTVVA